MKKVIAMVRDSNPQLLNSNDRPLGYRGFLAIPVRSPEKSHCQQASIQCWAIIDPPAKRHRNGVSLVGRKWHAFSGVWILTSLQFNKNKKKRQS